MVVFVGHTLLLRGIRLNIDDVANAIVDEVGGQLDGAMLCNIRILSIPTHSVRMYQFPYP